MTHRSPRRRQAVPTSVPLTRLAIPLVAHPCDLSAPVEPSVRDTVSRFFRRWSVFINVNRRLICRHNSTSNQLPCALQMELPSDGSCLRWSNWTRALHSDLLDQLVRLVGPILAP